MKRDLTGQRFGRLTVIRATNERGPDGGIVYECLCDCGNVCKVWNNKLTRKGHSAKRSCGCLQIDAHTTYSHGGTGTLLFHKWSGMKDRCNNPKAKNYKYYGGRGIRVCAEWENDFSAFRNWAISAGYVDGLSLDRIDPDRDYCSDNCRWVELDAQQRNKTSNISVTIGGETKTLAEWARDYDMPYSTVWARVKKYGWKPEKALTTPIKAERKSYE